MLVTFDHPWKSRKRSDIIVIKVPHTAINAVLWPQAAGRRSRQVQPMPVIAQDNVNDRGSDPPRQVLHRKFGIVWTPNATQNFTTESRVRNIKTLHESCKNVPINQTCSAQFGKSIYSFSAGELNCFSANEIQWPVLWSSAWISWLLWAVREHRGTSSSEWQWKYRIYYEDIR